jgi:hypothetical protein
MTNPSSTFLSSLCLASALAAGATGCAPSDDRVEVAHATLIEAGDTGPAERAWYTYEGGLSYDAFRPIAGIDKLHHLDVMDYRHGGTPDLEIGRHYIDGPAVNGRGPVDRYVEEDGVLHGDFPTPWIDLITCDGDLDVEPAACRGADQIEIWLESTATDAVLVHYEALMPGDTTPSVSGSFLAVKHTLNG